MLGEPDLLLLSGEGVALVRAGEEEVVVRALQHLVLAEVVPVRR